uniref:Uncharacterized protein n=1 Tax=Romanomermis culicivorax TaxID=13658 RepID=A0A915L269_ROMCU
MTRLETHKNAPPDRKPNNLIERANTMFTYLNWQKLKDRDETDPGFSIFRISNYPDPVHINETFFDYGKFPTIPEARSGGILSKTKAEDG